MAKKPLFGEPVLELMKNFRELYGENNFSKSASALAFGNEDYADTTIGKLADEQLIQVMVFHFLKIGIDQEDELTKLRKRNKRTTPKK
jgi:hypothetical protein